MKTGPLEPMKTKVVVMHKSYYTEIMYFFHIKIGLSDDTMRILKHDISNSVHHVLGLHQRCSQDFCKGDNGEAPGELPNAVLLQIKVYHLN